jgi:hypothetical protein
MDDVLLARALHVLAVVVWIGGVAMATTVVLPAVRRGDLGPDRLTAFQAIEHRFVWQARSAVIIVGRVHPPELRRLEPVPQVEACRHVEAGHVDIDGHYYSVPQRLIRRQLDARITERTIELFDKSLPRLRCCIPRD